jgi:hypothetical protein
MSLRAEVNDNNWQRDSHHISKYQVPVRTMGTKEIINSECERIILRTVEEIDGGPEIIPYIHKIKDK